MVDEATGEESVRTTDPEQAWEPVADRPHMPKGYLESKRLPFSWAERRLERAQNYWVATISALGRPHSRPIWGLWLERCFCFSTGSRVGQHLDARPEVTVHLESGDECVIVEGLAEHFEPGEAFMRAYQAKYGWDMRDSPGSFYRVRPRVVFAWLSDPTGEDGGALFSHSATRWTFPT